MIYYSECCPMAACAKSTTCVRYANYVKAIAERDSFTILNETRIHPDVNGCPYYLVPKSIRVAYGFTRLYKTIPVGNARNMSWGIRWGSDSTYFRTKRGDRGLSPAEQQSILATVKKYGGNPDVGFDRYQDEVTYVKP